MQNSHAEVRILGDRIPVVYGGIRLGMRNS